MLSEQEKERGRKQKSFGIRHFGSEIGTLWDQKLYLLRKHGTTIEQQAVLPVAFVPMTRKPESEDKP
jgi:hypothetical protein